MISVWFGAVDFFVPLSVISEATQVEKSVVVMVLDDASEICTCSRKTYQTFGRILIV